MANRATVEDATDSLVEDNVKTSFDSDDSFQSDDDDFDIGEIEEQIESVSKTYVVFRFSRFALEHHENVNCITYIICITHLYHKKIT